MLRLVMSSSSHSNRVRSRRPRILGFLLLRDAANMSFVSLCVRPSVCLSVRPSLSLSLSLMCVCVCVWCSADVIEPLFPCEALRTPTSPAGLMQLALPRKKIKLCPSVKIVYSVSNSPPPLRPAVFWHFSQMLENFISIFTHLLYVPTYSRLQIFIQLSQTLTKLCDIKRDYLVQIICSKCPSSAETQAFRRLSEDREQWRKKAIEWSSAVANRHRPWSTIVSEWVIFRDVLTIINSSLLRVSL